jgi:hypothetical protein
MGVGMADAQPVQPVPIGESQHFRFARTLVQAAQRDLADDEGMSSDLAASSTPASAVWSPRR